MNKHFIALVAMEGDYTGRIGQHSIMQPDAKAAELWAKERFNRRAVIVDMANFISADSLSDSVAFEIYRKGTNNGIVRPAMHVFSVLGKTKTVELTSDYYNQSLYMGYTNLPGSFTAAIDTAIEYLEKHDFEIIGICRGKEHTYSHIITTTFKPLVDE